MILYSYLFVRADYVWCHLELSYRSKGCNQVVPITCSSACKLVRYVYHSVASQVDVTSILHIGSEVTV